MSNNNDNGDTNDEPYKVGYGKPPKATQFKKGNTAQKKKGAKMAKAPLPDSLDAMLAEAFLQSVEVKHAGKLSRKSLLEVILHKFVTGLASGSTKEIADGLKLLTKTTAVNDHLAASKAASEPKSLFTPEQEARFLEADKEFRIGFHGQDDSSNDDEEPEMNDLDEGSL